MLFRLSDNISFRNQKSEVEEIHHNIALNMLILGENFKHQIGYQYKPLLKLDSSVRICLEDVLSTTNKQLNLTSSTKKSI